MSSASITRAAQMRTSAARSAAQVALPIAVVIVVLTPRVIQTTVGNAGMHALPMKHVSMVPVPVARMGIVPLDRVVVAVCASTRKPTLTTAVLVGLPVSPLNIAAMVIASLVSRTAPPVALAPTTVARG